MEGEQGRAKRRVRRRTAEREDDSLSTISDSEVDALIPDKSPEKMPPSSSSQGGKINWVVLSFLPAVVFLVLCIVMSDTPLRMYVVIRTCQKYWNEIPSINGTTPFDPELCKTNDYILSKTASFFPLIQLSEVIPLIALGSVYGYLSDRYGRKPVVLIAITGIVIDRLNIFFNAFLELDLIWLGVGKAISGCTGGLLALVSVCLAAIVDLTHPDERSLYIALMQGLGLVSVSLGTLLAGYITVITNETWVIPFGLSAILGTTAALWIGLFMKEAKSANKISPQEPSAPGGIVELYKKIISMFRQVPYGLMIPFFISIFAGSMKGSARTWFTIKRFKWGVFPDAVYGACESITSGLATVLLIPFIEKRVRKRVSAFYKSAAPSSPSKSAGRKSDDDTTVVEKHAYSDPELRREEIDVGIGQIRFYIVGQMIEHVLFGLSVQPWMIYGLLPLTAFGQMLTVPSRTMVAQIIEPDRLGFIQAVLLILEQVINAVSAPVSGWIWGSTVQSFIPTLYFVCAFVQVIAFMSTAFI